MASIVGQNLGVLPPSQRLFRQPQLQPTHKRMQAVRNGIWENARFGLRRIIRMPNALATEVSIEEPKGGKDLEESEIVNIVPLGMQQKLF